MRVRWRLTSDAAPGARTLRDDLDAAHVAIRLAPIATLPARAEILSDAERARADRFVRPVDAEAYRRAHAYLRDILAAAAPPTAPDVIAFAKDPGGKPRLASDAAPEFNLTHSASFVAVALSRRAPVGVDVEDLSRAPDWPTLARRWPAAERARIQAAPDPSRAFLAAWTRREALLKTFGRGVADLDALNAFDLSAPSDQPVLAPWGRIRLQTRVWPGAMAISVGVAET